MPACQAGSETLKFISICSLSQVAAVLEKEKRALGLDWRCREDDENRQRVHHETPFECASTKSNSVFCNSGLVRVIRQRWSGYSGKPVKRSQRPHQWFEQSGCL